MTLEQALLALLLAQPAYHVEIPDQTRQDRLEAVAHELSALPQTVAVALAVQGYAESGWARYVAEGCTEIPKGSPDCDKGRARGYWQLWRNTCPSAYEYAAGTRESLHEEVSCAARIWNSSARRCSAMRGIPEAQGGFAAFSGSCVARSSERRATAYRSALARLERIRSRPVARVEP